MIGLHKGLEQGSTGREAQGSESFAHFLHIRHHNSHLALSFSTSRLVTIASYLFQASLKPEKQHAGLVNCNIAWDVFPGGGFSCNTAVRPRTEPKTKYPSFSTADSMIMLHPCGYFPGRGMSSKVIKERTRRGGPPALTLRL